MKLHIKNVRIAFADGVHQAKAFNGEGAATYGASFIFEPDHPAVAQCKEAIEAVGKEKWGAKWAAVQKELTAKDRTFLHDGDGKANLAGFSGNMFISARSKTRPTVVDGQRNPLTVDDGKPYSGSYVHVIIEVWPQDNSFGKRINCTLKGVQFVRDGEAFASGGAAREDEFEEIVEAAEGLV